MKIYDWYRQAIRKPELRWWIILGTLLYVLSPIDLIPDLFFPLIGQVDDVLIFTLMVSEVSQLLIERVKNRGKTATTSDETDDRRQTDAKPVEVNAVQVE